MLSENCNSKKCLRSKNLVFINSQPHAHQHITKVTQKEVFVIQPAHKLALMR